MADMAQRFAADRERHRNRVVQALIDMYLESQTGETTSALTGMREQAAQPPQSILGRMFGPNRPYSHQVARARDQTGGAEEDPRGEEHRAQLAQGRVAQWEEGGRHGGGGTGRHRPVGVHLPADRPRQEARSAGEETVAGGLADGFPGGQGDHTRGDADKRCPDEDEPVRGAPEVEPPADSGVQIHGGRLRPGRPLPAR